MRALGFSPKFPPDGENVEGRVDVEEEISVMRVSRDKPAQRATR